MSRTYETFGRFILFKEVLGDELGHVYRAGEMEGREIRRPVWLRIFDAPGVPAADVVRRLDIARQIGSTLTATNIASNPSYVEVDGVPAMASDDVPGQPLSRVFRRTREEGFPVPVDNALLILEKISLAMVAGLTVEVSGSSLVHGFLHPGLVIVTNDGEAIVSGFGLSEELLGILDHPAGAAEATPYLAPEVLLSRTASKKGDVYSLGALLFQLLTGSPLPQEVGDRDAAVESAELAYEEQPVPEDIKALLRRSLARRPEDRFSSSVDFKKELDKLLYGGAYSPTTFNLALFMDRLFRSDIEEEERDRAAEAEIDVAPYLAPVAEPVDEDPHAPKTSKTSPMVWVAAAAVAVIAVVVGVLMFGRGGEPEPVVSPTPTAEQIAAERADQEARLQAMVQQIVQEKVAEREAQIREELVARQARIEELQKRLRDSERRATERELTSEEQATQERLQREIAAEEEAQRQREAELEQERQRAIEEARRLAEAQQAEQEEAPAETARGERETEQQIASSTATASGETPPEQPTVAAAEPTAAPEPMPGAAEMVVTENMFVPQDQVDTQPVILREHPVDWPRLAVRSGRTGLVVVQATVNAAGEVVDIEVLRADHPDSGIPEAVAGAVRQYRFRPATKSGVDVTSHVTVTKHYRFRER